MRDLKDIATLDDIKALSRLDMNCFKSPWLDKQWHYETKENPVSKVLVVEEDNQIIAYLDYWITFDSATIAKICVDPSKRRHHLAKDLMDAMMSDLKAHGVIYLTLEVRASNEPAIKLYESYGFKTITVKQHYYNDGEDANYMIMEVI